MRGLLQMIVTCQLINCRSWNDAMEWQLIRERPMGGASWRRKWAAAPLSKMQSLFTRCDSTLTQSMISPPGVPIARSASGVLHGELPSARSPVDPLLAPRSSSLALSHRDQRRGCRCSTRPRCPGAQRPTVAVLSAYNHARHQLSVSRDLNFAQKNQISSEFRPFWSGPVNDLPDEIYWIWGIMQIFFWKIKFWSNFVRKFDQKAPKFPNFAHFAQDR
jgi:hypothetical protein